MTGEVDGAPVVVTRDADGHRHGFHNVCRHRAGPVAIGKGARKSLTCKYHGWTYALDGRLVTTPELGDVKDFDESCHGLRPVQRGLASGAYEAGRFSALRENGVHHFRALVPEHRTRPR